MNGITLLVGDCRQTLKTLADGSVHCVVTSPPYFGLRDYNTATWDGGDTSCDHRQVTIRQRRNLAEAANACDGGNRSSGGRSDNEALGLPYRDVCGKCGAKREDNQIGLEETPEEYVSELVSVFREVRRVLRSDGVCWINIGDSYNGYMANQRGTGLETNRQQSRKYIEPGAGLRTKTLKNKDMIGIPWMLAFALRDDGWYLRQDIIWGKPAPMPESVTDRCTKSFEHVFLLTKSDRYFFDNVAIRETAVRGYRGSEFHTGKTGDHQLGRSSKKRRTGSGNLERKPASAIGVPVDTNGKTNGAVAGSVPWEGQYRNKRSVWTVDDNQGLLLWLESNHPEVAE